MQVSGGMTTLEHIKNISDNIRVTHLLLEIITIVFLLFLEFDTPSIEDYIYI